jgi:hypothetical protein
MILFSFAMPHYPFLIPTLLMITGSMLIIIIDLYPTQLPL